MVRPATINDAKAISEIYRPYVQATAVSFEMEAPSANEFAQRIQTFSLRYPFLVYEAGDEVIGYAYGSGYRERAAYQYAAAVSVYIKQAHHGQGIGTALYNELFTWLAKQGLHTCLAGITLPNEKSIGLHKAFGFQVAGILHSVGYKFGQWHDVMWMQKML